VLLDQADWFHAHGHSVAAVFFYDRDGLQQQWQGKRPYKLYNLKAFKRGVGTLRQLASVLQGLRRLWILLRSEHFDVIETFTVHSNIPGMIISWLAGVPMRLASHHGKVENVPQWLESLHLQIIQRFASVIVAVSSEVQGYLVSTGIDPKRIVLIPNGIRLPTLDRQKEADLRLKLALRKDQIVLISIGRLVYQKAHIFLVRAMQAIRAEWPEVVLYIAGEGPLRSDLEQQIGDLKLSQQVYLLGNRNDVPTLLSIADIFVLSSRWEGLSMAMLEAMGAGLPVVATEVEGMGEVIQQNIQGLLVPPEDADALAGALLELIKHPALRNKMGLEARQRIEKSYTTELMCEKYLKVMLEYFQLKNPAESK